jgi:hypothetical protein
MGFSGQAISPQQPNKEFCVTLLQANQASAKFSRNILIIFTMIFHC